ncbi:MAG: hypothetical protein P1U34_01840 [Coxiellaceae bacterium]|nr:hypothetical protein [Coxiellaceae bacterium]
MHGAVCQLFLLRLEECLIRDIQINLMAPDTGAVSQLIQQQYQKEIQKKHGEHDDFIATPPVANGLCEHCFTLESVYPKDNYPEYDQYMWQDQILYGLKKIAERQLDRVFTELTNWNICTLGAYSKNQSSYYAGNSANKVFTQSLRDRFYMQIRHYLTALGNNQQFESLVQRCALNAIDNHSVIPNLFDILLIHESKPKPEHNQTDNDTPVKERIVHIRRLPPDKDKLH